MKNKETNNKTNEKIFKKTNEEYFDDEINKFLHEICLEWNKEYFERLEK